MIRSHIAPFAVSTQAAALNTEERRPAVDPQPLLVLEAATLQPKYTLQHRDTVERSAVSGLESRRSEPQLAEQVANDVRQGDTIPGVASKSLQTTEQPGLDLETRATAEGAGSKEADAAAEAAGNAATPGEASPQVQPYTLNIRS